MPENENHYHARRLYFKTKNKVKGLLMTYRIRSKTSCLIMFSTFFSMNPLSLDIFEGCFKRMLAIHTYQNTIKESTPALYLSLLIKNDHPPHTHNWLPWQQRDRSRQLLSSFHLPVHRIHQESAETCREQSQQSISEGCPCPTSAKAPVQLQKVCGTGKLWSTPKSSETQTPKWPQWAKSSNQSWAFSLSTLGTPLPPSFYCYWSFILNIGVEDRQMGALK